jgi:hypothetical protein
MAGSVKDPSVARKAKHALRERYADRQWFRGVGIAPGEDGLILRLNVDPNSLASEAELPGEFDGIQIEVVFIDAYRPRSASE